MKKLFLCLVASTFIMLLPSLALAERVVFVSPEEIPPKIFRENGKLRGTYVDIIKAVCARLKINPVFEQYPWPRAVTMAKNGKADAIFPPFKTPDRLEFLYFPFEPVSYTRNAVFARKVRNINVRNLEDLKNLVVGINDQYSYGQQFDNFKKNLTLDLSRNEEMQINKLSHEGKVRMDVAAASEEPFKYLSKKMGYAKELEMVYVISETPSYVAFSKAKGEKAKKLAENFSRTLNQLKKEGVIDAIHDSYLK
nr:transporter substrate-binding domain-containing protein [Bacteriovorax sp. HI3]